VRTSVLFLLLLAGLVRADDGSPWSPEVNGLRGRIVIPAHQNHPGDPFLHVYLELQNTLHALEVRKIANPIENFRPQLLDAAGKEVPKDTGPYDGFSVRLDFLLMPFDSTLKFLVNGHGLGIAPGTRTVLDFGTSNWVVPDDGKSYFLGGQLLGPTKPNLARAEFYWVGVLVLPRVQVPRD
jgi:hypothetical protein